MIKWTNAKERALKPAFLVAKEIEKLSRLNQTSLQLNAHQIKSLIPLENVNSEALRLSWLALSALSIERDAGIELHIEQLAAAYWLTEGKVIDMATGEGKTFAGIVAASYLSVLHGSAHIMTANSHLAGRDARLADKCLSGLGITASFVSGEMEHKDRQDAYLHRIIYGTSQQFGFDYLKDQLVISSSERLGIKTRALIIDEVDAILIDDGKTPLIIARPGDELEKTEFEESLEWAEMMRISSKHTEEKMDLERAEVDAWHYRSGNKIEITNTGFEKLESFYKKKNKISSRNELYYKKHLSKIHLAHLAIQALHAYKREVDYVVVDGCVAIIERHTGRMIPGRRWSGGLHQLIEAKEGVAIKNENMPAAMISLQSLISLFDHQCGMSGSASVARNVLFEDYGLDVMTIPTNKPVIRSDENIRIASNRASKINAVVEATLEANTRGQPVLLGTDTIASTEEISSALSHRGVIHKVLNAKSAKQEAEIIACAGRNKAVTIATHMAGRGTDIVLDDTSLELGGLLVISVEPHEDQRLDVQLRGRAGRQGDPGKTIGYCSPEDSLFQRAGSANVEKWIRKIALKADETASHPDVDLLVSKAQTILMSQYQKQRKELFEKEYVIAQQRGHIYSLRDEWLIEPVVPLYKRITEKALAQIIENYCNDKRIREHWYIEDLHDELVKKFKICVSMDKIVAANDISDISSLILMEAKRRFGFSEPKLREIMLRSLDEAWQDHLCALDELEVNSVLQAYIQKTPRIAFIQLALEEFKIMIARLPQLVLLESSKELD